MTPTKYHLYPSHPLPAPIDLSRRRFISQSAALAASPIAAGLVPTLASGSKLSVSSSLIESHLAVNPLGFNGERQDPAMGLYPLGNGYRAYNPVMMRFHGSDNLSPFGQGGINSYAYSLGDPINRSDPSGHFAITSLVLGVIVGAAFGAGLSAATEGIQAAVGNRSVDWKSVALGSALGAFSGGLGSALLGARTGVQAAMAVADSVTTSAMDFCYNVELGSSKKQAGINAGIGVAIGLATFGLGLGAAKVFIKLKTRVNPEYVGGKWFSVIKDDKIHYLKQDGEQLTVLAHMETGEYLTVYSGGISADNLGKHINSINTQYNEICLLYHFGQISNNDNNKFATALANSTSKKVSVLSNELKMQTLINNHISELALGSQIIKISPDTTKIRLPHQMWLHGKLQPINVFNSIFPSG